MKKMFAIMFVGMYLLALACDYKQISDDIVAQKQEHSLKQAVAEPNSLFISPIKLNIQ